jgi:tetratricopeptide (TPR) repeat protein
VTDINKWRILLIATHRPEYQFRSHGNARGLTMNRLKRRDAAEMARLAIGDREISNDAMTRIVDESDLIPLFLEELARGTVDSPSTRSPLVHDPASESVIPESLRDALAVRLDRAPKARNVAQMAAVIGREFSYDLLSRLTLLADADLEVALTHLRDSDIIQVLESRPVVRYSFKHSLVRDIAYDSLLKSSRREMHLKIATILTQETTGPEAAPPELIAYHYTLAGNAELAVKYWLLGGRRARTQSAHLEASVQYQKALELLRLLPDTVERRATELDAQLSLGGCFIAMFGYSSNETRDAFESSYKLSSELGDWRKEFQANFGLWGHFWMRAQHPRAQELAETLLAKADQFHDLTGLTVGWRALGSTLFTFGDFIRARSHLERAVELGGRSGREELSLTFAVNPSIAAQLMLAWTLWILGYPDQARRDVMQALSRATELGDAYTAAFAHYVTSVVQLLCGEFERSLASADRSLALSREHRINLYALYSQFGRGCAHARMGKIELGMFEIKEGIEEAGRSKLGYMRGFMLGWLASVQAESGQPERALSTLDEALEHTNDVTGRAWEAELLRLRGDVLLAMHSDAFAQAERYEKAIRVAQKQSARALELRATTSLARLLDAQGRRSEARAKLSAAYEWFTEGFDTADLKAARQLLDELGERP